jgi:hypothetical protein
LPGGGTTSGERTNIFFWKISPINKLITGFEDVYEFSIHDLDGKLINKFGRKFTPFVNPNYTEGAKFSRYLPAFTRNNLFDEIGNFWVCVYSEREKSKFIYDVFTNEGIFIKQVYSKHRISQFKGERIYSVVRNDIDPIYIKAFKYSLKKRDK